MNTERSNGLRKFPETSKVYYGWIYKHLLYKKRSNGDLAEAG